MKQYRRGDLSGTPGSLGRTAALAALCASVTVCDRSSAAPLEAIASSLRFGVDHAAHVRQYDPVFQKPITEGGSGVPIGNGDLAAVVWEPDDLTIMLNKCDLGGTSQAARVRFITPTAKRLADRVGRLTTHLSLFDATATITYEGGKLPESAGWMWRGRSGAAPPPADEDLGTLSVVSYVPNGRNVLIVRYEEEPKAPHPVRIVLDRWVQKQFGDNVQA